MLICSKEKMLCGVGVDESFLYLQLLWYVQSLFFRRRLSLRRSTEEWQPEALDDWQAWWSICTQAFIWSPQSQGVLAFDPYPHEQVEVCSDLSWSYFNLDAASSYGWWQGQDWQDIHLDSWMLCRPRVPVAWTELDRNTVVVDSGSASRTEAVAPCNQLPPSQADLRVQLNLSGKGLSHLCIILGVGDMMVKRACIIRRGGLISYYLVGCIG